MKQSKKMKKPEPKPAGTDKTRKKGTALTEQDLSRVSGGSGSNENPTESLSFGVKNKPDDWEA